MQEFTVTRGPVLSYRLMAKIENIIQEGKPGPVALNCSIDLNLTQTEIEIYPDSGQVVLSETDEFNFPSSFDPETRICYKIIDGNVFPIQYFSEETNFYYKLVPTSYRPILRISATQMHKKPFLDYLEKRRLKGRILDAGTGLGYSAIIASHTADEVVTVEWDPNVIEIASFNPHSYEVFDAQNIKLYNDDVTIKILEFNDNSFDNIIHDGGMPKSSGNFFSQDHAHELYRVIKPHSDLYFYLPKKGESKGRDFAGEQIERMKNAGFTLGKRFDEDSFVLFHS